MTLKSGSCQTFNLFKVQRPWAWTLAGSCKQALVQVWKAAHAGIYLSDVLPSKTMMTNIASDSS